MTYAESLIENKKIIKMMVDFFSGKSKPVEEQILHLMQDAVAKQRFEYAAKLRDLYGWISLYTEKQHVVLSELVTWKVIKIREMEGWYVLAIINIYEGKMIDVIRLKYRTSDTEIEDILSDFRTEYGESEVWPSQSGVVYFTTTLKKIPKKVYAEVENLLDKFIDAQIASSTFEKENIMNDLLQWLQNRYTLPAFPYIIECTDISHLSGGWASWSLVSMKEWLLNKKWYRRYKIKADGAGDDYASLYEVITRRFANVDLENSYIPDVFIIDWWKWQLWIIKKIYDENDWFKAVFDCVHFCALGKWDARKRSGKIKWEKEELYRFENDWKIVSKQLEYDDVDRLITSLRDEAHRFANAYREKQMKNEWSKKTK